MGEYVKYKSQLWKLGTCEDLYYVTYDGLRAMIADGATKAAGNLEPREYLDPANGFRFRFPFPDEDGQSDFTNYSRGLIVPWPADVLPDVEHEPLYLGIYPVGENFGGYHLNAKVKCPLDPEADPDQYTSQPRILQLVQQRPFEGALWAVVRCAYCGQLWRLPPEAGATLAQAIRDQYPAPPPNERDHRRAYLWEVADRLEAGYTRAL